MSVSTQDSIVNLNNVNVLRGSSFRRFCGFSSAKARNKTKASIECLSAMNPAKASKGQRAAFTMIELIFSIVIVGLVILSIPLIVRQSNLNTIMSQNVIGYYNALTLMETIKSKPWDKNNVADFVSSGEYYILNTDEDSCRIFNITTGVMEKDDAGNDVIANVGKHIYTKKGLSTANKRRMCDPNQNKKALAIGYSPTLESINDFNTYEVAVYSDVNSNQQIFKLKVAVDYVPVNFGIGANVGNIGNPANGTTDVKRIQITLIRMLDNKEVDVDGEAVFTYYAANIGNDIPLIKDNKSS